MTTPRGFAPILARIPEKSMTCPINWDKSSATHSPRARTVRTPQSCATHSFQRTVCPQQLTRCVRTTVWDAGIPPPPLHHTVCVVATSACDAQRFPSPTVDSSLFGAVPLFPFLPGSGACSAQRLLSPSAASHCSEPTFPLPIIDFQIAVCLICDPSRKPMWAPLALDCFAVLANTPRWTQLISQTMKKTRLNMAHVRCHETGDILRKTLRRCGICSRTLPPISSARSAITPRRSKFDTSEVRQTTLTKPSVLVTRSPPIICVRPLFRGRRNWR